MDTLQLAETIRTACLRAAIDAYEDAALRGLCEAGRWEAAVGALQSLDLGTIIRVDINRED
ncbi:acetyltransferase [Betaproteobacteria bacterium SCN2]|jgi:hypothetical protein|nr:acetyltransferase [Betaproteobacteria bacterium SCN2]